MSAENIEEEYIHILPALQCSLAFCCWTYCTCCPVVDLRSLRNQTTSAKVAEHSIIYDVTTDAVVQESVLILGSSCLVNSLASFKYCLVIKPMPLTDLSTVCSMILAVADAKMI
ncbi:hypothetical protein V6N12_039433 [Hibiscus sabdariffa]|uniref:Uncharacterized protein n=1 Tax=Hibiscus sabdariffa TaxID=183260 RepID=A0ABR2E0M8_9ROSI